MRLSAKAVQRLMLLLFASVSIESLAIDLELVSAHRFYEVQKSSETAKDDDLVLFEIDLFQVTAKRKKLAARSEATDVLTVSIGCFIDAKLCWRVITLHTSCQPGFQHFASWASSATCQ